MATSYSKAIYRSDNVRNIIFKEFNNKYFVVSEITCDTNDLRKVSRHFKKNNVPSFSNTHWCYSDDGYLTRTFRDYTHYSTITWSIGENINMPMYFTLSYQVGNERGAPTNTTYIYAIQNDLERITDPEIVTELRDKKQWKRAITFGNVLEQYILTAQ